jgi:hypothetical protein
MGLPGFNLPFLGLVAEHDATIIMSEMSNSLFNDKFFSNKDINISFGIK